MTSKAVEHSNSGRSNPLSVIVAAIFESLRNNYVTVKCTWNPEVLRYYCVVIQKSLQL